MYFVIGIHHSYFDLSHKTLSNMFRLSELYTDIMKKSLPTECGITCEIVDPYTAKLNHLLTESVACFSYTLVISGNSLVSYNDKVTAFTKNDILIYTPGMMIKTLETSEDFLALCLMGDEAITYEIPYARNIIRACYFPFVIQSDNKLSLSDQEASWLANRMNEIRTYSNCPHHIYKDECLTSLYSLFILDLLNIESRFKINTDFNSHTIDIFLKFLRLLTENFARHHDIAFYADALAVTTIYLSRIVKRFSGQTVKNHIDRMLIMEATYLLTNTDNTISQIAESLHFANPSSFCKFFTKQRGVSPREYRSSGPINP